MSWKSKSSYKSYSKKQEHHQQEKPKSGSQFGYFDKVIDGREYKKIPYANGWFIHNGNLIKIFCAPLNEDILNDSYEVSNQDGEISFRFNCQVTFQGSPPYREVALYKENSGKILLKKVGIMLSTKVTKSDYYGKRKGWAGYAKIEKK